MSPRPFKCKQVHGASQPQRRTGHVSYGQDSLQRDHIRGPKDRINIRNLQNVISEIPVVLALRTRMSDPCVYMFFLGLYIIHTYKDHMGRLRKG